MRYKKTIEKVPTWALCYLVNGDSYGLSEEDIAMCEEFIARDRFDIVDPIINKEGNAEPYFTHYPAFGLPCEVEDCICLYQNKKR